MTIRLNSQECIHIFHIPFYSSEQHKTQPFKSGSVFFSHSGTGELVVIDGIMNSQVYREILDGNLQTTERMFFSK